MTRAFSLPSEALGYFIGYTLYHSPRVGLISPWISDVEVTFPITARFDDRQMFLSEAIRKLDGETEVVVLIRSGEEHNNYIKSQLAESVQVHSVDDLHAKAVVGEEAVYVGSANITRGGLLVNRELCQIVENEYGSVDTYIEEELEYHYSD